MISKQRYVFLAMNRLRFSLFVLFIFISAFSFASPVVHAQSLTSIKFLPGTSATACASGSAGLYYDSASASFKACINGGTAYSLITSATTGVTGSGTANYISKFSSGTALTNSLIYDTGTYVGIGTTGPSYKLDVSGDIRSTGTVYANANGAKYLCGGDDACLYDVNVANTVGLEGVQNSAVGSLQLGSTGATISGATGNIGIGTTDPTSYMSGAYGLGIYNSANPAVGFRNNTSYWLWYGAGNTLRMWNNSAGDILTANSSGNVGIGTLAPGTKLDIAGGVARVNSYELADAATNNLLVNGDFEMGGVYGWSGLDTVVSGGYSGYYAAQRTGGSNVLSDDFIPVSPTMDALELDGYFKKSVAGSTPGILYFGYIAYDASKNAITSSPCGTYCYFASSGYTLPADGNWHKITSTTYGEGTSYPNFPVGTKFVRVLVLINYASSADSVTLMDHVTLRRINNGPLFVGNNFSGTNMTDQSQISKIYTTSANHLILEPTNNVGIGNGSPSYKLDVGGWIRSSSGGFVFPDGTTQTTAAALGGSYVAKAGDTMTGTLNIASGDNSYTFYGPNGSWAGKLYVGATPNKAVTQAAQVISTDGNLHLDPAPSKNIYIGYYQGRDIYINAGAGNVGIGTTAPGYKLTVAGDVQASGTMYQRGTYTVCDSGNNCGYAVGSNYVLKAGDTMTGQLVLGNYGLGVDRSKTNSGIWFNSGSDTNHVLWNDYYGGPTTRGAAGSGWDGMKWNAYNGLQIRTGSAGATDRLIIDGPNDRVTFPNGNVGIGATSPSYKLQVQKTSTAPAMMISGGYAGSPRLQLFGLDADANAYMGLGTDMGGGPYEMSIYTSNYSGMGKITFGTYNGTTYNQKMAIDNSGNVGIGINPSYKLDVAGNFRSTIFYDYDNTGYYLDPDGTSNLQQITAATAARWGMPKAWTNRSSITGDSNYWTGSQGWGQNNLNTEAPGWGSTFFDSWSNPIGQPANDTTHWQGVQAYHYWNGSTGYGSQLVFGSPDMNGTMYVRSIWGGSWGDWYKVWTAGTDGSGSGLDADLLDGLHASSFVSSASLSSYVLKAGDTMTGHLTVNGGSSSNWGGLSVGGSMQSSGSIYSYDSICTGNSSGSCDSSGGVVLGKSAGTVSLTTGISYFNGGNVGIGITAPNGKLDVSTGSDGIVFGQLNGDNTNSIQAYIDGQYAARATYAGGCCNMLYIQKDAGQLTLGNAANGIQVPGVIYDGGDNAYYVDPNSVSHLNDIRVNIMYDRANTGYYVDPASGTTLAGVVQSTGDMRAPIFYDYNNTGYYLDPAGASRLNQLYYVDQAYIVDVRPQYMYDWNDSAYYMDFNNTSRLNILQTAGTITVGSGSGKIDVGTVDPPYTIDGKKYATYVPSMSGVKEEATGNVKCQVLGDKCSAVLDLKNSPEASDLWLFAKTTNLANEGLDNVTVLVSPNFDGRTWYEKKDGKIIVYAKQDTKSASKTLEISYRLTAPRFDHDSFGNRRADTDTTEGFNLDKLIK